MKYPYELLRVPVPAAIKTLLDLRAKGIGTPVILGTEESFEWIVESMELNDASPEELVNATHQIDIQQWLTEREAEDPDTRS